MTSRADTQAEPVAIPAPAPELAPNVDGGPSLGALLQAADNAWYRRAWTGLFARWSLVLPPEVTPDFCDYAVLQGLRCLIERGGWDVLQFFDRPVILKLRAGDGRRAPVMLAQLENGVATLHIDGAVHRVPVGEIADFWDGDFILIMRAPPGGTMYMELGGKGPDVGWLRRQLEQVQGIDLPSDNPLYLDYKLYQQVLAFQRDNALVTDGVVGRQTIIQLNARSGVPGIPRLSVAPS